MLITIMLAFVICLLGAFTIHTGTRAFLGAPADNLPGGALVIVASVLSMAPDRFWVMVAPAILGGIAGHLLSIWCWRSSKRRAAEVK